MKLPLDARGASAIAAIASATERCSSTPRLDDRDHPHAVVLVDLQHDRRLARPEVRELFTTAGDPDALARIRVDDMQHLAQVISQLRRSGDVTGTKTLMVLSTWTRPE